ncbi:D-2-hydroxyacid dehydrogenase [Altericroceibacterium endophyticum]|uniref:D-2-hydroxyacid dehydrogenase n=1 Tax=Altericroceibacterium endophyticum TaxID=1808508 RepID=A0A6I4T2C0_9SPHN|nr:D-2-hydroxyacid dehydrogenase [Altericroceibacterium endophyticum]MXO64269.1 D-2-hydroxyacid dehydrogenase [Altericroceibacterium endophyticum]
MCAEKSVLNAVLPAICRSQIEGNLPEAIEPLWYDTPEQMVDLAPRADIGWFDQQDKQPMIAAIRLARDLKWLNTAIAGLDFIPEDLLRRDGLIITNGAGISSFAVAEFAVMGMLNIAKGYRQIVQAQDRHEWLHYAAGTRELSGSRALLLGYGAIGKALERMLGGFGVECVPVRRSAASGALGPDEWQARLSEFDWVIAAVPSTPETAGMIGDKELRAMGSEAVLVNIARGDVVDQAALVDALTEKRIGGAFLDVTSPEPLPEDHPLWSLENAHISMHLSALSQNSMFDRAAQRFCDNAHRFCAGDDLVARYDPQRGY